MMHSISAKELQKMLEDKEEILLLDVRTPAEYEESTIHGATLAPLQNLDQHNMPLTKKIVCFCRSGGRSRKAVEALLAQHPSLDICDLAGGLNAWEKEGHPLQKSKTCTLPLFQQIHSIAGGLVLLGVLFGYSVHPGFFALTAFVGAGLLFSGLTGWCGLGLILARMPWNKQS